MNRIPLLTALLLALALGCNKKTKDTVADTPPPPAPTPKPPPTDRGTANVPSGGIANAGNKHPVRPSGGTGGGIFGGYTAARRAEALNELRTLGQEISLLQTELGRMPTKDQILAALRTNSKLLNAINEGSYILTGTTDPGGLWAYEVEADSKPGLALIGGAAIKSTPEEVQRYLQKK
jgi:hypothetical protein